ncbi:MAG TPA: hypothetical protein VMS17_07185 [Gemmataceae bacterium]|nr:hypothetical protein [Gemmataceae bacterium]
MKRGLLLLLGAVFLVAGRTAAEDPAVQEDMRFVQELRKQHMSDLALEYLERLKKTASPDLAKALPLEMARTRLEAAIEEPDSAKRLGLYSDARDEFQRWIKENPTDSRVPDVQVDLAQVTVQKGRTQLSRAYLNEDFETKETQESRDARTTFQQAATQLQDAAKNLRDQARMQADLDLAINLFDQAQTYPLGADPTSELSKTRNDMYAKAQKAFETLGAKDDTNPICWTAKAWAGRCLHMLGDFPGAKTRYQQVLAGDDRHAADAKRLTRYFYVLLLDELDPSLRGKDENDLGIINKAKAWAAENPGKSPELNAVEFLLAKKYEALALPEKDHAQKSADLNEALRYYRLVEASENDYTDRARRAKIGIIATQQNGFKEPIEQLKDFENCYVRAQYELIQQAKAVKEAKTPEETKKAREDHAALITAALERGLKLANESKKGDEALELANAKAMTAYQYLNAKRYREAIGLGEKFAKSDPRSSQAAETAVYVLQSYAELVGQEEAMDNPPAELPADRKSLIDFVQYMEKTWPKEAAGDMARHQLALLYINDKIGGDETDPIKRRANNIREAIKTLGRITPNYGNRTVAQYQLAQFCFDADKSSVPPLDGDAEGGYRKRALEALRTIPPLNADADPTATQVYFISKCRLAQEDFADKNYDEMEQLTQALLPLLPGATLDADPAKNQAKHAEFEASIKSFQMYAHWAKASIEADAAEKGDPKDRPAHYAKVLTLLDPIVDDIAAGKHPELQNNPTLLHGVLDNALRATIQLNKLDRTKVVLNGYKAAAAPGAADAGAAEVLKELVVFIPPQLEALKHKGDAAALEKAKKDFGAILADTIKPLQGDKLTPQLSYYTAKIYSSLDQHKEAAELLEKVPDPGADPMDDKEKMYQAIRLQLVRERRMNGEAAEARKVLSEIMGDAKKPGWGRREIPALIENIEVTAAEGNNKAAAELANGLAQKLLPNIENNQRLKEIYLQLNYMIVENVYRQGVKLKDSDAGKYNELVQEAAHLAVETAKKQLGFVTDDTRTRFRDLMDAEPDLKNAFLDAYAGAVEAMEKQAEAVQVTNEQRDRPMREKAFSDPASLAMELEKLWPDYGSPAAKDRMTALLTNAELKAQYDKLKGTPATP